MNAQNCSSPRRLASLVRLSLAALLTCALLPSLHAANTAPRFTPGGDQTINEDAGAQSVSSWATGIVPHSIISTPIVYGSDFTSSPPGSTLGGNARLDGGILKLTDAINSQQSSFATPEIPQKINSLTATFKVLVGGGTCCGDRTADGWSISFGNISLPVTFPVAAEEGAAAELVVSFDSWDNGGLDDSFTAPNADVKVNGTVVAYQAFDGVREGGRAPSGPFITDPATGGPMSYKTGTSFADVRIHLDPDGTLDVDFKGVRIMNNIPVGARELTNARLAFGARTGGANDNHWIDDLSVTAYPVDTSGAEAGQSVHFNVGNNNPSLFAAQPAISQDGTLTYTPAPNANGTAQVTVVAQDDGGTADGGVDSSAPVTFNITVRPVNDCPNGASQSVTVSAGSTVSFQLAGTDVDGDALNFVVSGAPAHGSVSVNLASGAATYTPAPGYTGPDSFTYTVRDAQCNSAAATVSIQVNEINRCPTAVAKAGPDIDTSTSQPITVLAANNTNACILLDGSLSTDADGDSLTYAWVVVLSDGTTLPLAAGSLATACLDVGSYTVRLLVDDGRCVNTADLQVEVVTGSDAVASLIEEITEAGLGRNQWPFISILTAAGDSFTRGSCNSAHGQLGAFINMVRAQLAGNQPALAADLIRVAQAILEQAPCE